jgi:hypothetical protein
MVYSTPHSPTVESYKEQALEDLNLQLSQNILAFPRKILVLGNKDISAFQEASHLDDFQICQYDNPHFVLRTGLHQEFSLMAACDDLFQSSFLDLKGLFERKSENPFLFFKVDDLLEMENSEFGSNLMNLSVEIKIHQTVKNTLGEDEIDSDIAYQSRLNNKNALEGELRNFLRRSVAEKRKPEETLDQAIKIIRSQPR